MSINRLDELEKEIAVSQNYGGRSQEVADAVSDYFLSLKGQVPLNPQIQAYILSRSYTALDAPADGASDSELEEAFYELTLRGMFARLRGEPENEFIKAEAKSKALGNPFYETEYAFLSQLSGENLERKLACDLCYEKINLALSRSSEEGFGLIGTGRSLAGQLNDVKRDLDLFSKCHYALYSLPLAPGTKPYYHLGLSLGQYLEDKSGNYHSLRMWTAFHDGNININLGFYHEENPEQSYRQALADFEKALDIADQSGLNYARMTLTERLATAQTYLGEYQEAENNFAASRALGKALQVKIWLASQNEVRCLLGLGDLTFYSGSKNDDTASEKAAELYKAALELANKIGDPVNQKIAARSLARLYHTRGKSHDATQVDMIARSSKFGFDYSYQGKTPLS